MSSACPQCHLPKEDSAWQCDGCGYTFRQDYDTVRSELSAKLRNGRIALWVTLVVDFAIVVGIIYLATRGMIVVSVPLAIAAVGATLRATRRISMLRDHLSSLDRRHVPLPKATVR